MVALLECFFNVNQVDIKGANIKLILRKTGSFMVKLPVSVYYKMYCFKCLLKYFKA